MRSAWASGILYREPDHFLPVTKWSAVRKTWLMGSTMPAWLNSRKQENAGQRSKSGTWVWKYKWRSHYTCAYGWTTHMSVLTSADGPIVTPAYIAVSHSETTDALGALQFITLVAGEMHCGSSPAVKLHTGKTHQHSPVVGVGLQMR